MNRTETIQQPSIFRMEDGKPLWSVKNTRASLTICEEWKGVLLSVSFSKQWCSKNQADLYVS